MVQSNRFPCEVPKVKPIYTTLGALLVTYRASVAPVKPGRFRMSWSPAVSVCPSLNTQVMYLAGVEDWTDPRVMTESCTTPVRNRHAF